MKFLFMLLATSALCAQQMVSVNVVVIGGTAKEVTFKGLPVRGERHFKVPTGQYALNWTSTLGSRQSYSESIDVNTSMQITIQGDKKMISYPMSR